MNKTAFVTAEVVGLLVEQCENVFLAPPAVCKPRSDACCPAAARLQLDSAVRKYLNVRR